MWEGRCQVVTRGDEIGVRLAENGGGTFAEAPVEKFAAPFVEAVVDSGRYFALRIVNAGRFAFVGIGFQERGHALSFKIALQEHFKREAEPVVAAPVPVATGKYKLAAGSSIGSIAIAGVGGKAKKKKKKSSGGFALAAPKSGGPRRGLGLAAPPTSSRRRGRGGGCGAAASAPAAVAAAPAAAAAPGLDDLMADFGSVALSAPVAPLVAPPAAPPADPNDPFGGLF